MDSRDRSATRLDVRYSLTTVVVPSTARCHAKSRVSSSRSRLAPADRLRGTAVGPWLPARPRSRRPAKRESGSACVGTDQRAHRAARRPRTTSSLPHSSGSARQPARRPRCALKHLRDEAVGPVRHRHQPAGSGHRSSSPPTRSGRYTTWRRTSSRRRRAVRPCTAATRRHDLGLTRQPAARPRGVPAHQVGRDVGPVTRAPADAGIARLPVPQATSEHLVAST